LYHSIQHSLVVVNSPTITVVGNSATYPRISSRTVRRACTLEQVGSLGSFQRSESTGNLSASWSMAAAASASGSFGGGGGLQYAGSVIDSDAGDSYGYISDGDRLPGCPLFICE